MQRSRTLHVPLPEQLADLLGFAGQDVGKHGNAAKAAHGEHGNDLIVVAGVNIHLVIHQRSGFHNRADVTVCFLDGYDLIVLGKLCVGCGRDGAAGTGGHVVCNDGLVGSVCNGVEHLDKTLLGCFVVVGGNDQHRIRAHLGGKASQIASVGGVITARACNDGHAVRRALNGIANDLAVLLVG